ncbi:MAG: hypothetical protein JW939_00670 [Candidatus Thermoplasmatota archaeon]|nr:hypothetical protein [Candidatus Thermoplasmatota archaeon]
MEKEPRLVGNRGFKIGAAGGALGVFIGLIQLVAGSHVGSLNGNNEGTLAPGLLTLLLSAFAIYCSYRASRETSPDLERRIGWVIGIAIPAGIGFMTTGLLWSIPGVVLLAASGSLIREIIREIGEKELKTILSIPIWKRSLLCAGFLLIIFPAVLGSFIEGSELASLEQGGDEYFVRPPDRVLKEEADGTTSSSGVTGVLIIHIMMVFGAIVALITGNLGARTLSISTSLLVLVSLLFFFFFLPNIMFIEGARFSQFEALHFSALSGGWFMSVSGTLLILVPELVIKGTEEPG